MLGHDLPYHSFPQQVKDFASPFPLDFRGQAACLAPVKEADRERPAAGLAGLILRVGSLSYELLLRSAYMS